MNHNRIFFVTHSRPFSTSVSVAEQITARHTRIEIDRGNGAISDNVSLPVARHSCGATDSRDRQQRVWRAPVSEALLRGNTPIVTDGLQKSRSCLWRHTHARALLANSRYKVSLLSHNRRENLLSSTAMFFKLGVATSL